MRSGRVAAVAEDRVDDGAHDYLLVGRYGLSMLRMWLTGRTSDSWPRDNNNNHDDNDDNDINDINNNNKKGEEDVKYIFYV